MRRVMIYSQAGSPEYCTTELIPSACPRGLGRDEHGVYIGHRCFLETLRLACRCMTALSSTTADGVQVGHERALQVSSQKVRGENLFQGVISGQESQ